MRFGADDIDGTVVEEKIYHDAGSTVTQSLRRGELLRLIKQDESLRLIPVAVLTTSESDKDIRDAYELHANCYLRKPIELDSFLTTVRTAANFWLQVAYTTDGWTPPK